MPKIYPRAVPPLNPKPLPKARKKQMSKSALEPNKTRNAIGESQEVQRTKSPIERRA